MTILRCAPYIAKQIMRNPIRSLLTISSIALAMFLFTAVQAMNRGVDIATTATANDTTLVVYREDRYCPATSELPQDYQRRIEAVEGVVSVTPMKIVVSNCRASLDVVTYRGVPKDSFLADRGDAFTVLAGSLDDWHRRTDAALVGEHLARRRGLEPGMRFTAAGITVYVAAIIRSDDPQDQNVAYTSLEFVQLAGRDQLGIVTQFNVRVVEASLLEPVSNAIDEVFRTAQEPTATFGEKAFIGRLADDIIELVGFTRWLGPAAAIAVAEFGDYVMSVEGTSIPVAATPALIVSGLIICTIIGVLAGLVPAWQASRQEITASFRAI